MPLTMYTYPNNARAYKGLIAAQYCGVQVEQPPKFKFGTSNKEADFLALNPFGKVPALKTEEGTGVFESNAIARYIAGLRPDKNLFGRSFQERGLVDSFIDTATSIELNHYGWLYVIKGYMPFDAARLEACQNNMKRWMTELHTYLQTRTFLVGERITLADIVLCCTLYDYFTMVFDDKYRKSYGNVCRWFNTLVNQPEFKAVMGEVKLCEKATPVPGADAKAATKSSASPKKSPAKGKKSPAKKGGKSPAKSPAKAADKPEEKKGNPLAALPKSSFVLDEWKRTYSNKDTRTEAIPWFWENLDLEGYSLWWADYKYNDELEKAFMTCNLVGGFFQRLDRLRKYGFGSAIIFGDEPKLKISCLWLFRGQDIPEEMTTCDDSELYEWRRADAKKEKELINDFLAWDGKFNKKLGKFNQGKIFK